MQKHFSARAYLREHVRKHDGSKVTLSCNTLSLPCFFVQPSCHDDAVDAHTVYVEVFVTKIGLG
jgi:hypothetical protein